MTKKTFTPCSACGHEEIHGRHHIFYWTEKDGARVRIFLSYSFCDNCGESIRLATRIRNDRRLTFSVGYSYVMKIWNKANSPTLRSK